MSDNGEKTKFQYDATGLPIPAGRYTIKIIGSDLIEVWVQSSHVCLSYPEADFVAQAIQNQEQFASLPSGVAVGWFGPGMIIRGTSINQHIDITGDAAQKLAGDLLTLAGSKK